MAKNNGGKAQGTANGGTGGKAQGGAVRQRRLKLWLAALILAAGLITGFVLGNGRKTPVDGDLAVFRIGVEPKHIDYDLWAAIRFLDYMFREAGYEVGDYVYIGDLYPKWADKAGVNVFIRGFVQFFDLRMNPQSRNVFYMHRFSEFYVEELRNYDGCLSSQKKSIEEAKAKGEPAADYLPSGAVPHPHLKPEGGYEYDVLYIYEEYSPDYDAFIQRFHQPKVYSGQHFAKIDDETREAELRKARLVVYEMSAPGHDDEDYVPYAAYDIISYGRPLLTNRKTPLTEKFGGLVWQFDGLEEMKSATAGALGVADDVRERQAGEARQILRKMTEALKLPFFERLKAH